MVVAKTKSNGMKGGENVKPAIVVTTEDSLFGRIRFSVIM